MEARNERQTHNMKFLRFCALVMAMGFIFIAGAATGARALECDACTDGRQTKFPVQFLFCNLAPDTQYRITLASGGVFTGAVFSGVDAMKVECGSIYFKTPAGMEPGKGLVISVGLTPYFCEDLTGSITEGASGAPVKA